MSRRRPQWDGNKEAAPGQCLHVHPSNVRCRLWRWKRHKLFCYHHAFSIRGGVLRNHRGETLEHFLGVWWYFVRADVGDERFNFPVGYPTSVAYALLGNRGG